MKRCDSVSVFTDWFHSAHWDHLWRNVASLRENGDEMKQHKDIIVSTKYLISNEMRVSVAKIRNFRPACPARIHFIFPRVSGLSVSSLLRNKSTNTRTYCTDKRCYFTNKILLSDWEESQVSDAKVPKFRLARNNLYGVFSSFWFSGRNKSSWIGPYHEC